VHNESESQHKALQTARIIEAVPTVKTILNLEPLNHGDLRDHITFVFEARLAKEQPSIAFKPSPTEEL
jgi:hypothetical protein